MKKTIKIVAIVVCLLAIALLIAAIDNKPNYLTFNYQIESITTDEDDLIITFYGDEQAEDQLNKTIEYVVNGHQVDLQLLQGLSSGDQVSIVVKDNYGKFMYTILYQMTVEDQQLFDLTQLYQQNSVNNKVVFASMFASAVVCLLLWRTQGQSQQDANAFKISSNPYWAKMFFMWFTIVPLGGILAMVALYALKMCDVNYLLFSTVLGFFPILGLFGLVAYKREYFAFEDQQFVRSKLVGKAVKVPVSQVKLVVFKKVNIATGFSFKNMPKIYFLDYNNNVLASYSNDGRLMQNDLFKQACNNNDVSLCITLDHPNVQVYPRQIYNASSFVSQLTKLVQLVGNAKVVVLHTNNQKVVLNCYPSFVDVVFDSQKVRACYVDLPSYVNFDDQLKVKAPINFNLLLDNQIFKLQNELVYVMKIN